MNPFRTKANRKSGTAARFGYAVVGLGRIAEHFLQGMADSPACAVTALVSSDPVKARKLADRFQVPHALVYADFDSLRHLPDVHAVYLALPVSMHREFTERAARAGKHVLCEKPMASDAADASAMIDACAAADVLLSIAYRCPHTSVHQQARDLVRAEALGPKGTLRVESQFGFRLGDDWRTNGALAGGGSLYDVGIYPLNAARYLLEEDPSGVRDAEATCDGNGLEQRIAWTSTFPSGARAVCRSSYLEDLPDRLRISGERGELLLAPAFSHRERLLLSAAYTTESGAIIKVEERMPRGAPSQFRLEAEQLADAVRNGVPLLTPGEDGLADMLAMSDVYRAAGVPPIPNSGSR